jgi:UDP-N-acetylmuramyl pentapeptide synthase
VAAARAPRKIAVLGGSSHHTGLPKVAYAEMIRQALAVADRVYFTGSDAKCLDGFDAGEAHDRYRAFATTHDLNEHLKQELRAGDLVFVAAGRNRVHLERLILDRTDKVVCWREDCNIPRHCRDCHWFKNAAAA